MRQLLFCLAILFGTDLKSQVLSSLELDTAQEFTNLTDALKNPDIVYKLNLKKQKLTKFPLEILLFQNLNSLDVSKNKLQDIPPEIGQLKNLQKFIASKNNLEFIPVEIGELVNLTHLQFGENNILFVPYQIGKLTKLVYLDLWSNEIHTIPDEIKNLTNLQRMDLRLIQISNEDQKRIRKLLPNWEIFFSSSCGCN